MIQLTPTLYAVNVPLYAENIRLNQENKISAVEYDNGGFILLKGYSAIDFSIIGTCSPDGIDFDCEPLCEVLATIYDGKLYQNHQFDLPQYLEVTYCNAKDSFRSLLTSKGCDLSKKYVIVTIKK